jgi:tryptophan 2,3-dioxygenase
MTAQLEAKSASPEQNHYWRYHRLPDLLACKQPLTNSMDEDLFISVHQICELSFHQMAIDLDRALQALSMLRVDAEAAAEEASYFLERVVSLYGTVNGTAAMLSGMRGFVEFRHTLGAAGFFQSLQFRRIEIMSGAPAYWRGRPDEADGRMRRAEAAFERQFGAVVDGWLDTHRQHSLRHYFDDLLARAPGGNRAARLVILRELPALRRLRDLLQAYDEARAQFHGVHVAVAERQLARTGAAPHRRYLDPHRDAPASLFDGLHAAMPATGKAA